MNARSMGKNHASKATAGEAARGGSREVVAQRPPRYVTLNRVKKSIDRRFDGAFFEALVLQVKIFLPSHVWLVRE